MGVAEAEGDVEEEASYNNNHPKVGSLAVLNILEKRSFHRTLSGKDSSLSVNCVRSTSAGEPTLVTRFSYLFISGNCRSAKREDALQWYRVAPVE